MSVNHYDLIKKIRQAIEDEGYYIVSHDQTSLGDYFRLSDHCNLDHNQDYHLRDYVFIDFDTEEIFCRGTAVHLQNTLIDIRNVEWGVK